MAEYLMISSLFGYYNHGLKKALIYIGKYYGRLNRNKVYKNDKYLECGIKFVSKKFGYKKSPIRCMIKHKKIKESDNTQVWYFHKNNFQKIYRYIVRLINKLYIKLCKNNICDDRLFILELMKNLLQDVNKDINENNDLSRTYSNALVLKQKNMLELYRNNYQRPENERILAGNIVDSINYLDTLYNLPPDNLSIDK